MGFFKKTKIKHTEQDQNNELGNIPEYFYKQEKKAVTSKSAHDFIFAKVHVYYSILLQHIGLSDYNIDFVAQLSTELDDDLAQIEENIAPWLTKNKLNNDLSHKLIIDIIAMKKEIDRQLLLFINDHITNYEITLVSLFATQVESYQSHADWVDNANDVDWCLHELDSLADDRTNLHFYYKYLKKNFTRLLLTDELQKLRQTDDTVQEKLLKNPAVCPLPGAESAPHELWWWFMDDLKSLSKKELETI